MFRKLLPFVKESVKRVPRESGVYILYERSGQPVYVGRSRRNIRERLLCHLSQRGNRKIAMAIRQGIPLKFEYEPMISVEQVEAVLIRELGTSRFYNLRRETDPADWD